MQELESKPPDHVRDILQAVRLLYGDSAYWKYVACEWAVWAPIMASLGLGLRHGSWLWCSIAIVSGLAHRLANPSPSGIGMIVFAVSGLIFAGIAMANGSGWMFAAAWLPLVSWYTVSAIHGTAMVYIGEAIAQSDSARERLCEAGLLVHTKDLA